MLSKDACSNVTFSKDVLCNSPKELLQSRDFYFLVELYCNKVVGSNQKFEDMLNVHFNDEGYIDCWRLPHLLIDIHERNYQFHKTVLDAPGFLVVFFDFLLGFYNYCMSVYRTYSLTDSAFQSESNAVLQLNICKHQTDLMMDSFRQIVENIEYYKNHEGGL